MHRRAVLLVLLFVLFGCAHYPINSPLQTYDPEGGYRFDNLTPGEGNSDSILLCLTFSGGGTLQPLLPHWDIRQTLEIMMRQSTS